MLREIHILIQLDLADFANYSLQKLVLTTLQEDEWSITTITFKIGCDFIQTNQGRL